jgi:hypothetical protein
MYAYIGSDVIRRCLNETLTFGPSADNMLTFLRDGKFIDAKSELISVDIITYNAVSGGRSC